ncbi:MAG: S1 RNA-binding domain-containing protein [Anaerolineae bacterium]
MPEETTEQPTSIEGLEPKTRIEGTVTRTELYGAFVDVGLDRDGLIHISKLAPGRVRKVTDVVNVGDKVSVWVQSVDPDRGRIALTMVEPPDLDWHEIEPGQIYEGEVVRLEPYGAFVDIGAERPGLLHVREMASGYVRSPEEVVHMGETIQVQVRSVDGRKRQIDLTLQTEDTADFGALEEPEEAGLSPMEIAFLQAQAQAQAEGRRFRDKGRGKQRRSGRGEELEDIYRRTLDES